jgi:hypothetical protein
LDSVDRNASRWFWGRRRRRALASIESGGERERVRGLLRTASCCERLR